MNNFSSENFQLFYKSRGMQDYTEFRLDKSDKENEIAAQLQALYEKHVTVGVWMALDKLLTIVEQNHMHCPFNDRKCKH